MNTGITFEMQDHLGQQTELLELISGDYVRKDSGELYEANIKHLFPNDSEQAKLINPGSYIGSIIYDWFSSYTGEPREDNEINYIDLYEGLLTTGYLRFFQNVDTKKLESIKANKYYYDELEKKEYFLNLYVEGEYKFKKNYLLVETFCKGVFERKLFLLKSAKNLKDGEEVPLDTLSFLKGTSENLKISNLKRLVIEKQIERPILNKIKTIVFSIEKKLSEADKNFLNYTEQFKIFRNLEIPDNAYKKLSNGIKIIDFDKLGKLIITNDLNGGVGGLEIVNNTNNLLVKAIEYIDKQLRSISSITGIPLFAFGIKLEGGNDSGTSKIKSAGLFYKKVEKYRKVFVKLFEEFWDNFGIKEDNRLLEFDSITTTDPKEIIDNETSKLNSGTTSRIRAIMKQENISREEAEIILEEIEKENLLYPNSTSNEKYGNSETNNEGNKGNI